jgi:hypothetical protein
MGPMVLVPPGIEYLLLIVHVHHRYSEYIDTRGGGGTQYYSEYRDASRTS